MIKKATPLKAQAKRNAVTAGNKVKRTLTPTATNAREELLAYEKNRKK
jgi:hypothetical protein